MFGAKINFWPEGTPYNNNQGRIILLHLIWMFIVGIIIGAIARFLMPGSEHMSILMTGILGIVGSLSADSLPACSANRRQAHPSIRPESSCRLSAP